MGFLRRLFGLPDDPVDEVLGSIGRNATLLSAPHDDQLWKQAEASKGHIDLKAVSNEYNRLILANYGRR
jgi:hypothetical protein